MRPPTSSGQTPVAVRPIRATDVAALVNLHEQFEGYLKRLDPHRRAEALSVYQDRLRRDGFGRRRKFHGYLAVVGGKAAGYLFYHYGYDPDEMKGPVVWIIDLYVRQVERRRGVGTALMEAVAARSKRLNAIDIYFGVWNRNKAAQAFYTQLGARPKGEIVFHHWTKSRWGQGRDRIPISGRRPVGRSKKQHNKSLKLTP